MARQKPSYLGAPSAPPMSEAGQTSQRGAQHFQSLPSWQTNVPTNAGPGPGAIDSPQFQAATRSGHAGPHVPAVWVQQYAGLDDYGVVRSTYGDVYAGPPTQTLAWQALDGWQYAIYTDYAIKVLRSQAHGTVPAGALNGTVFSPGSKEHYAIIKQWFAEVASHPVGSASVVFMQRAAQASKSGGESLLTTMVQAGKDMIAVVTGSSADIPTPPKAPTGPAPVPQQQAYAPAPDGTMVPVPPPGEPSKMRKAAPYIGGGLLALAAFGGLYWYFGTGGKKKNPFTAESEDAEAS
jgi:hypothetical protein